MGRKNLLLDITESALARPPIQSPADEAKPAPSLGMKGAVGAMSRSLEKLSAQSDAAQALADRYANGEAVIDVEASAIDASFVPDRMPGSEADHASLVASIAENGQLVPVLLRPHPDGSARFQTAYGHRRIRALRELGKPVRAVIRKMTDEQLIVAQGKENGERRDLTFIERAVYAVALEDRNFPREVIGSALSVDKTELSRLIGVARSIPRELIDAIGSAPKAGRGRWMELGTALSGNTEIVSTLGELLSSSRFVEAASDKRFQLVLAALTTPSAKPAADVWKSEDGKNVASIDRRAGERTTVAVNEKLAPGFGEFVVGRLGWLYAEFLKEKGE